jgi:hypothetical protein
VIDVGGPFTLEIKKKAYTGSETALKGNWEDLGFAPCSRWSRCLQGEGAASLRGYPYPLAPG